MSEKPSSHTDQGTSTVALEVPVESGHSTDQVNGSTRRSQLSSFSISRVMRRYQLNAVIVGAIFLLLLAITIAIFWRTVAPYDPLKQNLKNRLLPPVPLEGSLSEHLLGTDSLGRDLLSNILFGIQISLKIGVIAVVLAAVIGCATGMVSGYFGGIVSAVFMRLVDLRMSLPGLFIAMFIAVVWGTSVAKMIILIAFIQFTGFARVLNGETLTVGNREFILAARALGASHARILLRHIMPNLANTIIILTVLHLPNAILIEATLSFLGFGVPLEIPSLGRLVFDGYKILIAGFWWASVFPGLALFIMVMAVNIVGDWLREYLDPRLRDVSN